jgi:Polysaccharide biosynthesis protein
MAENRPKAGFRRWYGTACHRRYGNRQVCAGRDHLRLACIAMSVMLIAEAVMELPVGLALTSMPRRPNEHYDTAFTLQLIRSGILVAVLVVLSIPLSMIYNDQRGGVASLRPFSHGDNARNGQPTHRGICIETRLPSAPFLGDLGQTCRLAGIGGFRLVEQKLLGNCCRDVQIRSPGWR